MDQLKTALASANQATLQQAWLAAGGPRARYGVPPTDAPPPPPTGAAAATAAVSKMSSSTIAAIAFPIGTLALLGLGYFWWTNTTDRTVGPVTKFAFYAMLATALLSTTSAVMLAADTQINLGKLTPPKEKASRRTITYGLAATAIVTAVISGLMAFKYQGELFTTSLTLPEMPEAATNLNYWGMGIIGGCFGSATWLAIDRQMNKGKRPPAEQKKRDIAMGVLFAVGGLGVMAGIYKQSTTIPDKFRKLSELIPTGDFVQIDREIGKLTPDLGSNNPLVKFWADTKSKFIATRGLTRQEANAVMANLVPQFKAIIEQETLAAKAAAVAGETGEKV